MEIEIEPFQIVHVATTLTFKIIDTTDDTCTAYYELIREDGVVVERGKQSFPIQALAIIATTPMDVTGLNQLLSVWGLEAKQPTE